MNYEVIRSRDQWHALRSAMEFPARRKQGQPAVHDLGMAGLLAAGAALGYRPENHLRARLQRRAARCRATLRRQLSAAGHIAVPHVANDRRRRLRRRVPDLDRAHIGRGPRLRGDRPCHARVAVGMGPALDPQHRILVGCARADGPGAPRRTPRHPHPPEGLLGGDIACGLRRVPRAHVDQPPPAGPAQHEKDPVEARRRDSKGNDRATSSFRR